mmetsp:Transcript_55591/g.169071  ORF Transcript_55591/g.169071 Transcript_55591/m.169071 type:complete len:221 (+) Transcript_55591:340-1002(+)
MLHKTLGEVALGLRVCGPVETRRRGDQFPELCELAVALAVKLLLHQGVPPAPLAEWEGRVADVRGVQEDLHDELLLCQPLPHLPAFLVRVGGRRGRPMPRNGAATRIVVVPQVVDKGRQPRHRLCVLCHVRAKDGANQRFPHGGHILPRQKGVRGFPEELERDRAVHVLQRRMVVVLWRQLHVRLLQRRRDHRLPPPGSTCLGQEPRREPRMVHVVHQTS